MFFTNVIGNEEVKETLTKSINNKKISHSYMFIGTEGIGKLKIAKEFAKILLCINEKGCDTCKSCIEFNSMNNPDLFILDNNGETIKIEQIRNIQSKILEKPIISKRKIYIINDADNMTKEAQNCLLKTLEEPPQYAVIILIGANEERFLNTIKSRCTKIKFKDLNSNEIKKVLEKEYNITDFSENMIKASCGSIIKAVKIYENKDLYIQVENIFDNIEKYKLIDVLNKLDLLYKNKDNIIDILDYINVIFFQKITKNIKYVQYIEMVEKTKEAIKNSCNYDMSIDKLLFEIWKE